MNTEDYENIIDHNITPLWWAVFLYKKHIENPER